jgi:uracil phosphoribosyltransferase
MEMPSEHVHLVQHPLATAELSVLRARETSTEEFRRALQQISILLLIEAARGWKTSAVEIETPLRTCAGAVLSMNVMLVPILRAGLGMLDGMLRILPGARVGHLGLYRDEVTLRPVTYYQRLPGSIAGSQILLLDPMLATGHSACEATALLKAQSAREIQFVCVVACAQGIAQMREEHPDVQIIAAAIDPELNEFGYIVPGLGDAGDRYFATT